MGKASSFWYRIGMAGRVVLRYAMPFFRAMAASSASVETASLGYSTTQSGMGVNRAMSSSPICEGPSPPMLTPTCDPTNFMFGME